MPFLEHLVELRDRLLRVVLAVVLALLVLLPFANDLYSFLAAPLLRHLPEGTTMIATEVASPFLAPFKLALVSAVFLAMPFALYQAWGFVAPGLYQHERRFAVPLLASSILLFYLGMAFAYFVVFPIIFGFFTGTAPEGVAVMTDISKYLDFVLTLFFAFGVAFEVPIATVLLVWTGITTPESLVRMRPYVLVGAFVIGMLITPPDVFSQTFVALPMALLFEVGIVFSRIILRAKARREAEGEAADDLEDERDAAARASAAGREGPLTPEDMDRELDRAIAEEGKLDRPDAGPGPSTDARP
jgi:sec-independent protein translocase protein TatC